MSDSRPLCRYFMNGACKHKDGSCPFSHDFNTGPSMVCKYYLQGCCVYGEACRYDHTKPQWATKVPQSSSSAAANLPHRPVIVSTTQQQHPYPGVTTQAAQPTHTVDVAGQLPDDLWGSDDDSSTPAATSNAWQSGGPRQWAQQVSGDTPGAATTSTGTTTLTATSQPASHGSSQQQGGSIGHTGAAGVSYQDQEHDYDAAGYYGYGDGQEEGYPEDLQAYEGWTGQEEEQAGDEEGADTGTPSDLAHTQLCGMFSAYGRCTAGDACRFVHGEVCPTCNKHVLHPYNQQEAERHTQECEDRSNKLAARLRSAQVECGICLEKVMSAAAASDRRFGLLSCDHAFCLKCIRAWRSTGTADVDTAVRACPVCRATSYFITPSLIWPADAEEKAHIIEAYKCKLASIDCMHFKQGEATCPFGTSCFYRHMYKDGRLESREPNLRTAQDETGGVKVLNTVRLSDFFNVRRVPARR